MATALRPQPPVASTPTGSASSSSSSSPLIAPIPRVTPSQLPPSALKSRRRSASVHGPSSTPFANPPPAKIGPQRTSKVSQKLKILPSPEDQDEESGRDVYSQVTRIKDTTARRDAERLGKAERAHLPRVTAYATANAYKMDGLLRFLKSRSSTRGTSAKQFDECIYTPYSYSHEQRLSPPVVHTGNLIDLEDPVKTASEEDRSSEGDTLDDRDDRSLLNFVMEQNRSVVSSEVFLYQYGVVVIWGMTVTEEQRFLKDIARFESEKLGEDDVQVENFNFYVTSSYQPRIYNDFITLKDGGNYMIKLSISHAIAQSVKVCGFRLSS